jgi:hypothetical protein
MVSHPTRRAVLLAALTAAAAPPASAQPGGPRAAASAAGGRLDLRLGEALPGLEPSAPPLPAPPPLPASPPEPGPRAGLSLELQRGRGRGRDPADPAAEAVDRDALAGRLERLGIEELVIRLTRPL